MVITKKTEAILQAIGIYFALNAFVFGATYIVFWVSTSSIGQWLEINKPIKPYSPAYWYLLQFAMLFSAFVYYRHKMGRD